MRKLISIFIIVLSIFYGSSVFAAENGDTTTTIVTYVVPESFKWTAPTDVTFDAADEIKTSTLVVSENIIPYNSFLVISIPEQEFVLTSSEGVTRNYKVYLGENELTVGSEVLRIKAGTTEGSVDVSFKVPQVENIKAGTYTGTLNFVAKVTGDYGITYYLNGGTNNASNPAGYKMNEGDVTILEPTKLGYTFAGWYDNAEFIGSPITKITNGTSGNVNLYAKWSASSYTINYNLDGGTNNPSNPSTYTADMLPLTLEAPTKDGYAFLGWNDGSNDVTGIPAGTTGNVSLTARWDELSYSITYNLDGGVLSGDYPTSYTASTGLDTLPVPTKDGYTFAGWYENATRKITKGDIIKLSDCGLSAVNANNDGAEDTFRVLSIEGTQVKLLAMDSYKFTYFNSTADNTYSGSILDTEMTNYYNALPENVRNAIVEQNINQSTYSWNNGTSESADFSSWYKSSLTESDSTGDNYYLTRTTETNVGNRKVYALDVDDVIEYLGSSSRPQEINEFFFDYRSSVSRYVWLRSAIADRSDLAFTADGYGGGLGYGDVGFGELEVRPAFILNISSDEMFVPIETTTSIATGTTGDKTLTAKWLYNLNIFSKFNGELVISIPIDEDAYFDDLINLRPDLFQKAECNSQYVQYIPANTSSEEKTIRFGYKFDNKPWNLDYTLIRSDKIGVITHKYKPLIIKKDNWFDANIEIQTYLYTNSKVVCLTGDMYVTVTDEEDKKRRKKKIKDIKVGDYILSFDWKTMKLVPNKVIYTDAEENKFADKYDKWYFEDGTIIKTVHRHEFYNCEAKRFMYMDEWKIGDHAYKEDGTKVKLIKHETVYERVQHYKITGEKGTNYFANTLLNGDRYNPEYIDL